MSQKILTKRLIKEPLISHWLQKPVVTIVIALLGLALILGVMTMNIIKYEDHLAHGDTVLLALAPVDPRGFMQGDYMTLSYALERDIFDALQPNVNSLEDNNSVEEGSFDDSFEPEFHIYEPSEGYVIVKTDTHNVGHFSRLAENNSDISSDKLAANELAIYYRIRNGEVKLATNAFFFQEGHAESFEAAEYGLFRVNDKGEPLLTEMVNSTFDVIKGEANPVDSTVN